MSSFCKYNDVFIPKIEIVGTVGFVEMSVKLASCNTYDAALKRAKQWIEDNKSNFWYCVSISIEKFSSAW